MFLMRCRSKALLLRMSAMLFMALFLGGCGAKVSEQSVVLSGVVSIVLPSA